MTVQPKDTGDHDIELLKQKVGNVINHCLLFCLFVRTFFIKKKCGLKLDFKM